MLIKAAAETNVITYLMIAVGVLGVMAKIVNHITLNKLVKAAGNMPKSTNKLIKLVRAKYEHACMIHGAVGNVDSFVEKYIYEYRGVLFRIHTWRQIELMSVWGSGMLAGIGALSVYLVYGLNESIYQYLASGAAEMVLLSVLIRMTDEPYKINALKMYMTDYLENICAFRLKRMRSSERDTIDVITRENGYSSRGNAGNVSSDQMGNLSSQSDRVSSGMTGDPSLQSEKASAGQDLSINIEGEPRAVQIQERSRYDAGNRYRYEEEKSGTNEYRQRSGNREESGYYQQDHHGQEIENQTEYYQKDAGEGRDWREKPAYRQKQGYPEEGENRQNLKEETIRQILEEFLA